MKEEFTPIQLRIIANLETVGTGPVAFFKDSIRMLRMESLDSRQHIISHLMREIESSIREVLTFIFPDDPKNESKNSCVENSHLIGVNKCISLLKLAKEDDATIYWKKLSNDRDFKLAKKAHRDNLDYRRFSVSFIENWNEFENFLDRILVRLKSIHFQFVSELDNLLKNDSPGKTESDILRNKLPKSGQFFYYFFNQCKNANWFDPLYNSGHLSVTKDYILERSDQFFFHWSPIYYLQFLAREGEHEKVWKVVSELPDNDSIGFHIEITKLVNLLPLEFRAQWMERLITWIHRAKVETISNPDPFRILMRDLVETHPYMILEFMKGYFRFGENVNSFERESLGLSTNPNSRLSDYEYFESIRSLISSFLKKDLDIQLEFFQFLCNQLDQGLSIEYPKVNDGEDHSYITRSSILDDPQNYNHHFSDQLVPIIRDVGGEISNQGLEEYRKIQEILGSKNWILFERLHLHFCRVFGLKWDFVGTKELFFQKHELYFNNIAYLNETFYFLEELFSRLNETDKDTLLGFIKESADASREKWIRNYGNSQDEESIIPYNQEDVYEERLWKFLSAIHKDLIGAWKEEYLRLDEKYKQREFPPQYASYHWSFVGPVSPIDKTEIASMTMEELISYLEDYEPEEEMKGHSREGLSRQLSREVENNPERYLDNFQKLLDSNFDLEFHNGILYGLRSAIDNKNAITLNAIVDYLYGLHSKYEGSPTAQTTSLSGLKDYILGVYRSLYEQLDKFEKSDKNIELVRNIFPYLDDPSPDAKYDKANNDPIFTGINSVRGETLHALFKSILWLVIENDNWKEERFSNPVIDEILEKARKHFTESQYKEFQTDRSVLGEYLRFIYKIRKEWFEENLDWLLPASNKEIANITFYTYIQRGGFSTALYLLIKNWYLDLLKDLKDLDLNSIHERGINPVSIAEHIMLVYVYELETLEQGSLIDTFFNSTGTPDFLKGNAIRFLGTKIPKEEKFILLAKALWEWRVQSGKISGRELEEFLEWWNQDKFENEWIFPYLNLYNKEKLRISGFHMNKLFKILDENFDKNPSLAVGILDSYSKVDQYHLSPQKDGNLWSILKKGLDIEDQVLKTKVEDIVHKLGFFGYLEYRELLGL